MSVRLDRRDVVLDWCRYRGRWVEVGARLVAADPERRFRQDSMPIETWARCFAGSR